MYQTKPVGDDDLAAMGAVRYFGFQYGRPGLCLYDRPLSVLNPEQFGVGGMDSHRASPPPFVPGRVAHVRVRHHVHVVASHENHRVFFID